MKKAKLNGIGLIMMIMTVAAGNFSLSLSSSIATNEWSFARRAMGDIERRIHKQSIDEIVTEIPCAGSVEVPQTIEKCSILN